MNKKILCLALLGIILLPLPCFAAAQTIQDLVTNASKSLTPIGAGLATISFIVAGIMYLMGTGNPGRMATAKASLVAGVTGIVIIILAESAQQFVKTFFGM